MTYAAAAQVRSIKNVVELTSKRERLAVNFLKLLELKSLLLEDLRVSIVAFEQKLAEVRVSL